ncbi:hypothetical protein [Comamonas antarctica]|uniref:Uncharacterized protein n=1 Tax=Comamonas antarctica TaxID=2743470 RepID=A0A6N1XBE3_9BURK|nr:hypothetical protein [Comamonas antarctica]QKV55693.1 hypothetical protein HUK68_22325 [Comamonas antarctica]
MESISVGRSGQFYLLKKALTDVLVEDTFIRLRNKLDLLTPSDFVRPDYWPTYSKDWQQVRSAASSTWKHSLPAGPVTHEVTVLASAMVHPFVRHPLILPKADMFEHRLGYLLILEMSVKEIASGRETDYLFVQRDLVPDPLDDSWDNYFEGIPAAAFVEPFYYEGGASRIERMSFRKVAAARGEVNRKVLDAYDVGNAVSTFGLHRTIGGSMQLALPAGSSQTSIAITAHNSRLRAGVSRTSAGDMIRWATECVSKLSDKQDTTISSSAFLSSMAKPLETLLRAIPVSLVFDHLAIEQEQEELLSNGFHGWQPFNGSPVQSFENFIDALREPIEFDPTPCYEDGRPDVNSSGKKEKFFFPVGWQSLGADEPDVKLRITAKTCRVIMAAKFGAFDVDASGKLLTSGSVVSRMRAMRVSFNHGRAMYCLDGAFELSNLPLSIRQLSNMLVGIRELDTVHSEKGSNPAPSDTNFGSDSSFWAIENSKIVEKSSILICDDATDEWCDYLEISTTTPKMRWLHAKVQQKEKQKDKVARKAAITMAKKGNSKNHIPKNTQPMSSSDSLSASDLQEVISQAIKNLGRLRMQVDDEETKKRINRWTTELCTLPASANISRMRQQPKPSISIKDRIEVVISSPLAVLEVGVVIPNYSAKALKSAFSEIGKSQVEPQVVQAFWLLSSFMNSCLEVGATPYAFMRD